MPEQETSNLLYQISVWVIPVVFAITVHEVAHGWVAKQFGDMTAANAGRLTLNPIRHVDPIGTVAVPFLMLWLSGFAFGWAKPVPVVPHNLRNPRRDMLLVAVAGPGVNFLMALGWAIIYIVAVEFFELTGLASQWLLDNIGVGIRINVTLAVFNLLPIPPLDGGRVLASLVPPRFERILSRFELLGIPIVLALWFFGLLQLILLPPITFFINLYLDFMSLANI